MPRLKKRGNKQIVRQYYGINPKTFEVECVSETKGGTLSIFRNGRHLTHGLGGRDGRSECIVAFDLNDVEEVAVITGAAGEREKNIIEKLKTKATRMKKGAEEREKKE